METYSKIEFIEILEKEDQNFDRSDNYLTIKNMSDDKKLSKFCNTYVKFYRYFHLCVLPEDFHDVFIDNFINFDCKECELIYKKIRYPYLNDKDKLFELIEGDMIMSGSYDRSVNFFHLMGKDKIKEYFNVDQLNEILNKVNEYC